MPPRPVTTSVDPGPTRIAARPPRVARNARRFAPSRPVIIPLGSGNRSGIGFGWPSRLSITTRPDAPASSARTAFEKNVQCPRLIRAMAPASEPRGSGLRPALGSRPIPQSRESTGRAFVPVIEPMSTSVRSEVPQPSGVASPVALNAICRTSAGAAASRTLSAGA
jgi:hypothetical protein